MEARRAAKLLGINFKTLYSWLLAGCPCDFRYPDRKKNRVALFDVDEVRAWRAKQQTINAKPPTPVPADTIPLAQAAAELKQHESTLRSWIKKGAPHYKQTQGRRVSFFVNTLELRKWKKTRDDYVRGKGRNVPDEAIRLEPAAKQLGVSYDVLYHWITKLKAPKYGYRPFYVIVEEIEFWKTRRCLKVCPDCNTWFVTKWRRIQRKRCKACRKARRLRQSREWTNQNRHRYRKIKEPRVCVECRQLIPIEQIKRGNQKYHADCAKIVRRRQAQAARRAYWHRVEKYKRKAPNGAEASGGVQVPEAQPGREGAATEERSASQ